MPRRTPRRSWLEVAVTLTIALQTATPAWAWGRLGHRVISRIAEKNLTPKAKAAIAALLNEGESIADASTWADENRRKLPKTASWHYVDVPLDEPRYDAKWSADDPRKGCVVDKINEFRATVKDSSRSVEVRVAKKTDSVSITIFDIEFAGEGSTGGLLSRPSGVVTWSRASVGTITVEGLPSGDSAAQLVMNHGLHPVGNIPRSSLPPASLADNQLARTDCLHDSIDFLRVNC